MANSYTSVGILWILCIISASRCWDLEELKPVSCPDISPEEGVCYTMVEQQVRCLNLTIGRCDQILDPTDNGLQELGIRRYYGHNDICMVTTSGYCTKYSCRRSCCGDSYTEDIEECVNPYCNKDCQNGGTCIWSTNDDEKLEKCECTSPYTGEYCENVICDKACENGGSCVVDGSVTVCTCPDGFYGTTCSFLARNHQPQCPEPDWSWNWFSHHHDDHHGHHDRHDDHCDHECRSNSHCSGGKVCCYTGRCRECVEPPITCYHKGKSYRPGDVVTEKCEECVCTESGVMTCDKMDCPAVYCDFGIQPVKKDSSCCPQCPVNNGEGREPPRFWNCRDGDIKRLPVTRYTSVGMLENLGIKASKYNGDLIEVEFSPEHVSHCKCSTVMRPPARVAATASDEYGASSQCSFWVTVYDNYKPVYNSCPADIFAQEGEFIEWNEPRANDNVGIRHQSCDTQNKQVFDVGRHRVTCTAVDYDDNKAYCQFTVYVYESGSNLNYGSTSIQVKHSISTLLTGNAKSKLEFLACENNDTDESTMPAGLQARKKKTINSAYIIASTFSALFIVILLVFIGCFIHRRRVIQQRRQSRGRRDGQPPIHTVGEVGLYDVIGQPGEFKLPPYSPKIEPPPYDEIQSRDADMLPPTYDAATNKGVNPNIGRGFLNEAYARVDEPIRNQQQTAPSEEEVYEEIRLN